MQNNRFLVFGIASIAVLLLISSFAFAATNKTIVVGSVYDYSFDSYAHDVSIIVECNGQSKSVTTETNNDGQGYYAVLFDEISCSDGDSVTVKPGSGWVVKLTQDQSGQVKVCDSETSSYCGESEDNSALVTNVAVVDLGAKQQTTTSSGGGGSGRVNRTGVVNSSTNESVSELTFNPSNANPIPESNESQDNETEPTSSGITGAAVGALGLSVGQWILLVIVLAGIVGLFFFVRSRNSSRLNTFY